MEKFPKAGKYQPVKSYSMVYDQDHSIVTLLEEKDVIDIKTFQRDPDIPGKVLGWFQGDEGPLYVIFSYRGIQHFKPYVKPKKKKGEEKDA